MVPFFPLTLNQDRRRNEHFQNPSPALPPHRGGARGANFSPGKSLRVHARIPRQVYPEPHTRRQHLYL